MIRGDLLHAKTAQVVAEHRREVLALERTRARESHTREKVRDREDRFWRAIARASTESKATRGTGAGARAVELGRAIQAHHDLTKAKGEQRQVSGEFRRQVARVITSTYLVGAYEKLRAKDRALRTSRLAERRSEEVEEVALSHRMGQVGRSLSLVKSGAIRDEDSPRGAADAPTEIGSRPSPFGAVLPRDVDVGAVREEANPHAARSVSETPTVSIHAVRGEVVDGGAAIQMRMESAGSPVACRLESSTLGRVEIRVEVARPSLVSSLERERVGIIQRLKGLGISVEGFQIGRDLTASGGLSGSLRRTRQPREEDDENVIA